MLEQRSFFSHVFLQSSLYRLPFSPLPVDTSLRMCAGCYLESLRRLWCALLVLVRLHYNLAAFPLLDSYSQFIPYSKVLGAIIAFFRARYMMRDLIQLFARRYTIIRAADRAIKRNGFRVMLLLRLCPIIPFNGLNYIGGITAVHWEAFTFSLVGILPLQILTVTMGATSQTLLSKNDEWQLFHIILVCSGMAFLIIAVAITGYFAKKELGKELSEATELQERSDAKITSVSSPDDDATLSVRDEGEEVDYLVGVDDEEWFWMFA